MSFHGNTRRVQEFGKKTEFDSAVLKEEIFWKPLLLQMLKKTYEKRGMVSKSSNKSFDMFVFLLKTHFIKDGSFSKLYPDAVIDEFSLQLLEYLNKKCFDVIDSDNVQAQFGSSHEGNL